jgi:hypothetical protein
MININGKSYYGNNISINNGKVIIDGINLSIDEKIINITVDGNIDNLSVDSCESLTVSGNVAAVKTVSGDVICQNILGSVKTVSGDVTAKVINGNVNSVSGDIN